MAILKLKDISKSYEAKRSVFSLKMRKIRAVHKVSLEVKQAATLGLVGESGCGKSTLAKIILTLLRDFI